MLGRHGREVVKVMKQQIGAHSDRYMRARLPNHCLIMLIGQHDEPVQRTLDDAAGYTVKPDESKDAYVHWKTTLKPAQRPVVNRLEQARDAQQQPTRWGELKEAAEADGSHPTRMEDVFRRNTGWREFIEQPTRGYWQLRAMPSTSASTNVH